jgi:hypothetical protein
MASPFNTYARKIKKNGEGCKDVPKFSLSQLLVACSKILQKGFYEAFPKPQTEENANKSNVSCKRD